MIDGCSKEICSICGREFLVDNLDSAIKTSHVNICLDRDSFLSRKKHNGEKWREEELGSWNNGDYSGRKGVYLSMFYALINKHPRDPNNPWNEEVPDNLKGLGRQVHYLREKHYNKPYWMTAFDSTDIFGDVSEINIEARESDEEPFISHPNAIGLWDYNPSRRPQHIVFIKSDYHWITGKPMDEEVGRTVKDPDGGSTTYFAHLTQTIAHEVGHALGLGHAPTNEIAIMRASNSPNTLYSWQTPSFVSYIRRLLPHII